MAESTPARVCILGRRRSRSRSQYFWFEQEPEFALRSVQDPIKIFRKSFEIFAIMLAIVKQNGIN